MLTRMLFLIGLISCGIVALSGAWPASIAPPAPTAEPSFVPRSIPLDADIIGTGIDAAGLLAKALAKFGNDDSPWLHVKIRQTTYKGEARLTAEGFLQRGPNHCARLEMATVGGEIASRLVIVSDGETLVEVEKIAGAKPIALVHHLPTDAEPERAAFLAGKCCGGPAELLRCFHKHLQAGTLQTGQYGGRSVIQIQGDIDANNVPAFAAMKLGPISIRVYLDAKTLWPTRIEWHAPEKSPTLPLSSIEFLEPTIGVPLGEEECIRMFSYHADGNEHVTTR